MSVPLAPFTELVVVDRGDSVAGAYCAKLFADLGARVHVDGPDELTDAQRRYLRRHTTTIGPGGGGADPPDVVIESASSGPLPPATPADPTVVRVRLDHHGPTGPRADWVGSDLTDAALGGHLVLTGHPDRAPLQGPANQPAIATGLYGFIGAMAALLARGRSGRGQTVEVDHVRTLVALHQFTLLRYSMTGDVLRRMGNRFTGQGQPNGLYRCADGWIAIAAPSEQQVEYLLDATGLGHLLDDPRIDSPLDFQTHPVLLDDAIDAWLADRTVAETVELLQAMRVPAAPAPSMTELLADPQLTARDAWDVDDDGVRLPRSPLRFGPPRPGGVRSWLSDSADAPAGTGPLAGLRVLDLTRVWAGPLCTRVLADLGADVVTIEAPWARGPRRLPSSALEATRYYPDDDQGERPWNRNGHLIKYGLGKRSVVIDLEQPAGRDLLADLVPAYDVLIENYSPRVMPNLGFDEERLHRLNPDLIYVTMPGYGRSGPSVDWLAYGSTVDSHAGYSGLIGYADAHPWKGGVAWPDPIAGLHAAGGLLKALWDREASAGHGGCTIEQAQFEAAIAVVGDRLVEAQVAGDPPPPGNRDGRLLAQAVLPCRGDDRWIAISIIDRTAWSALADLADLDPELLDDHDRLDAALSAWTTGQDHHALAARLQGVGVCAAPVLDAADLLADPHLLDAFVDVDQPDVGRFTTPATPIALSATPVRVRAPAPTLGQHNREVLAADAGVDGDRLRELADAGIVTDEPPG